ncbi:hypothetical protein BDZ94DRAFT_1266070 [Collybia nuda]|uniref:Uncharacterized protein n=1 Tax=Collybia nuda TaxID=64659 RepID=A0A9P6CFM3_9AGAR|nr:hypothetical protein BDZ94DRAFT_1266070 [Collybia nuda]
MSTQFTELGQHRQPRTPQRPTHRGSRSVGAPIDLSLLQNIDTDLDTDIEFPPGLPPSLESAIRSYTTALRTRLNTTKASAASEVQALQAELTHAHAKQRTAEDTARTLGRGMADLQREAVVMGRQLAEFGAAMVDALKDVGKTRAGAAEAIRVANASAVYWEEVARGEAAEAVIGARAEAAAAREEVRGLKRELKRVRRELEAVKAREERKENGEEVVRMVEAMKDRGHGDVKEEVLGIKEGVEGKKPEKRSVVLGKRAGGSLRAIEAKRLETECEAVGGETEREETVGGEEGAMEPSEVMGSERVNENRVSEDEELMGTKISEPEEENGGLSETTTLEEQDGAYNDAKEESMELSNNVGEEVVFEKMGANHGPEREVIERLRALGPGVLQEGFEIQEGEIMEPTKPVEGPVTPEKVPLGPPSSQPIPLSCLCRTALHTQTDGPTFDLKQLWPNGQIITYRFLNGHPTQHTKVSITVPEWSRYANITFRRVPDDVPAILTISFEKSWECWRCLGVGTEGAGLEGGHAMALGAVGASRDITYGERAFILHQFGHVLGLGHEYVCPIGEPKAALPFHGSMTNYVVPDLNSVMVFPAPYALGPEANTHQPSPTSSLSQLDKAYMVLTYPRTHVHSQAREWTLNHTLHVFGADAHTSNAIAGERNLTRRRVRFAEFLMGARRASNVPQPRVVALTKGSHIALASIPHQTITDTSHLSNVQVKKNPPISTSAYTTTRKSTTLQPTDATSALHHPHTQHALLTFLANPVAHPIAKDILADPNLKTELVALLTHLARHRSIRGVIQRAKSCVTKVEYSSSADGSGLIPEQVASLLGVVLMLHGASAYHGRAPTFREPKREAVLDKGDPQATADALWAQLARHVVFRVAMERAVEQRVGAGLVPDVSMLIARLVERPAVLKAMRKALLGDVL